MKFAIFVIALIACASATSLFDKYPLNFSSKRSIMTLLTQVEAKLKTGGPLDAITKMLDDFVATVTEEQVQHDALHAQQQEECAAEFAFRKSEVDDATAALKEATETLDGCKAQHVRATGDLAATKKALSENRSYLATITDTRRREAYAFETATQVYQAQSAALDEALVILEQIWAGEASFIQLAKHTNKILKGAVKIRKAHLMAPVMSALAQLAQADVQADEALLERVKNLLINFQQKIEKEFQDAAAAEQAAIALFEEDKARLESTIEHLEQNQLGLETEIAELEKCIVTQTGIVTASTAKRDRNQKLWDDSIALCQAVDEEYKSATQARKEELELLAAIRERVEARFAQLSEGVKERGKQDEFSYENKTEYNKGEFEFTGKVE